MGAMLGTIDGQQRRSSFRALIWRNNLKLTATNLLYCCKYCHVSKRGDQTGTDRLEVMRADVDANIRGSCLAAPCVRPAGPRRLVYALSRMSLESKLLTRLLYLAELRAIVRRDTY